MIKAIIAITTYNLKDYIAQAIDSILCQKTDFEYKIIIADDCSQDGTVDILKQYKEKYPETIELMLSEKNNGSLVNSNRIFDGLDCEYFSFLDGDDYWIGDDRLQKQVVFLDKNPEYSICAGNTQYLRNDKPADYVVHKKDLGKSYAFQDMLENRLPFFHTSSMLLRNTIFIHGLPACFKEAENTFENCALRGEDFRRIIHLEQGKLYAFNDVLSIYRIHSKGLWQGSSNSKRAIEGAVAANFYKKYFEGKYSGYFSSMREKTYGKMMRVLITEDKLLKNFRLTDQETQLFTSLLTDIGMQSATEANEAVLKKWKRLLLKAVMKAI